VTGGTAMAKSRRLTLAQLRAVYRLVDECRELGDDPRVWKAHLLRGLARLVPGAYFTTGELGPPGPGGPRMLAFDDLGGMPTPALQNWQEAVSAGEFGANPVALPVAALPGRCKTRRRRDVLTDREWYRSAFYTDRLRPSELDDGILSLHLVQGGGAFMISPGRAIGDRPREELVQLRGRDAVTGPVGQLDRLTQDLGDSTAGLGRTGQHRRP